MLGWPRCLPRTLDPPSGPRSRMAWVCGRAQWPIDPRAFFCCTCLANTYTQASSTWFQQRGAMCCYAFTGTTHKRTIHVQYRARSSGHGDPSFGKQAERATIDAAALRLQPLLVSSFPRFSARVQWGGGRRVRCGAFRPPNRVDQGTSPSATAHACLCSPHPLPPHARFLWGTRHLEPRTSAKPR